jgi:hypothetical protein
MTSYPMRLFPAFLLLYALENSEIHLEIIGRKLTVLNRHQETRAITHSAAVEAGSHNCRGKDGKGHPCTGTEALYRPYGP